MKIKIEKTSGKGFKFVILKNNKEIGRAYLYLLKNDLHKKPFAFVEDVFIKKDYRSKGYGTKLVKALIKKAKKENCYKVVCTSRFSRKKVHTFYNNLGFKKHGYEFRINLNRD